MEITQDQAQQIKKRQIANALAKLNAGKSINQREQRLIDEITAEAANFALSWDDLAKALSVTRRAIQDWRKDQRYKAECPKQRADGRHDINAWRVFMLRFGLKRADEVVDPDEVPEERRTIRDWKEYREQLMCTQLERSILRDDRILLVATELEIALGQLIAGVSVALDHFAPSASRFVTGLRDIHEVQIKLQSEIDAVKQRINAARYLDDCIDEVAKSAGVKADNLREALRVIGRRAMSELGPEVRVSETTPVAPVVTRKRKRGKQRDRHSQAAGRE